jgi:hypothetical protein
VKREMPFERVGGQEVRAEESRGDDEVERKEGEAARPEAANSAELATGCFIRWAVEAVDRRRGSEGRRWSSKGREEAKSF